MKTQDIMPEQDIKNLIHHQLDAQKVPSDFENIWEAYTMNNCKKHKKSFKALILAAALATVSVSAISAAQVLRITDNIDLPFKEDDSVLGTWRAVDFVEKINDFDPEHLNCSNDELYLKQLIFKENGKVTSATLEHGQFISWPDANTWTKGVVLHEHDQTASKYTLKNINGEDYMFLQWKSGDYTSGRLETPYYYVLKKVYE